jgi:hypothetical protein
MMFENKKLDQKIKLPVIVKVEKEDKNSDFDLYKNLNSISFRLSLSRLNTFYISDKNEKKKTA